jgi:hypothetical protein
MPAIDLGEWTNRLDDYARRMVIARTPRTPRNNLEEVLFDTEPYSDATDELEPEDVDRLEESFYRSYDMYSRAARPRGGFRRRSQTARFNRCVKGVRKTIKPRPNSSKESAAIAICTKSVLQTRGKTLKKYRKGRLRTQKLLR